MFSSEFTLYLIVFSHSIIFLSYIGIGFYVWPKFDAAGPGWGVRAARGFGITYFATCAYTHAHEAAHIIDGASYAETITSWHYITAHILQAISALGGLFFGWKYTSLRFVNPEVAEMLDRMTKEARARLKELKGKTRRDHES